MFRTPTAQIPRVTCEDYCVASLWFTLFTDGGAAEQRSAPHGGVAAVLTNPGPKRMINPPPAWRDETIRTPERPTVAACLHVDTPICYTVPITCVTLTKDRHRREESAMR